ncbi:MAG: hypothetical protein GX410_11125 [Elusimicrobia bacterium]|nr:hypothetical protein [Elusimicrobiota bacterium]
MTELFNAYGGLVSPDVAVERIRCMANQRGVRAIARELRCDPGTISKIANSTSAITAKRIMARLCKTLRPCPVLGAVTPLACAEHARFAVTPAARMVSNPDKQAIYAACRKCKGGSHGK